MKQRGYSRHSKDHNPPTRWPRHQRPRFWRRKRFSSCNFFRIYVRCSRIKIARQYLRDSRTNRRESTRAQSGYLFHKGIRRRKTRSSILSSSSSSIFLLSRSLSFSSNVKKYPRARFVVVPHPFRSSRLLCHVPSIFTVFRGNAGLIVPIELSLFVVRRENGGNVGCCAETRCIGPAARQKEMAEKERTEKNEIADFASDRPSSPLRLFRNCAFCSLRIVCPVAIFLHTIIVCSINVERTRPVS